MASVPAAPRRDRRQNLGADRHHLLTTASGAAVRPVVEPRSRPRHHLLTTAAASGRERLRAVRSYDDGMRQPYTRLTQPLVRDNGQLRLRAGTRRSMWRTRLAPEAGRAQSGRGRALLVLEGDERDELPRRSSSASSSARTTSTPATALDALRWSVWPPSSGPEAAPPRIARSRRRMSSSSGARTPARRTRSSSSTS